MKKVSAVLSVAFVVSLFGTVILPKVTWGNVSKGQAIIIKLPICPTGVSTGCRSLRV